MPEGAEYRREQRLERERGEAGGGDCCLAERSGGVGTPAWEGRGPKRGERGKRRGIKSQKVQEKEEIESGKDRQNEEERI